MSSLPRRRYTSEQYWEMERRADYRSEYVNGEILAMAGGTEEHSVIAVNTASELRTKLKGKPCRVCSSDMKVHIMATDTSFYPDLTVVCGESLFANGRRDVLLNPTLIVEVLSNSTEAKDRVWKFAHYRRLDSLQEYVMIAQDAPHVERCVRQPDNQWLLSEVNGRDGVLELLSLNCHLSLTEIYDKIVFGPDPVILDETE